MGAFDGLGKVFGGIIKKASATVILIKSGYDLAIGDIKTYLSNDGTGELTIKTETAGKSINLDAKNEINSLQDGTIKHKISGASNYDYNDRIITGGKELRLNKVDNSDYGSITRGTYGLTFNTPGGNGIICKIGGTSKWQFNSAGNLVPNSDNDVSFGHGSYRIKTITGIKETIEEMDLKGPAGSIQTLFHVTEEVTIAIGSGAGGVLSTAFVPAGSLVKRIMGRVILAPGGGATDFDACINGDGNKSLGDTIAVALNTTFDNLVDGDGNRSNPWGQQVAVEIKTTTDIDVTGADMIIRYVVFYEGYTPPTG